MCIYIYIYIYKKNNVQSHSKHNFIYVQSSWFLHVQSCVWTVTLYPLSLYTYNQSVALDMYKIEHLNTSHGWDVCVQAQTISYGICGAHNVAHGEVHPPPSRVLRMSPVSVEPRAPLPRPSQKLCNLISWYHHGMTLLKSHRMLNCTPQLSKAGVCFMCRRKCGPLRGNSGEWERLVEKLLPTVCWSFQFLRLLTLKQDWNKP